MKKIYFFETEECNDSLFNYPCIDSNSKYLERRTTSIFGDDRLVEKVWLSDLGSEVFIDPSEDNMLKSKIAIVCPPLVNTTGEEAYYQVLDYYILTLQSLVKSIKNKHNYKHIVVILPSHADEYSTEYDRMAYYSIYGLIKGLGKTYAQFNLFINGIILNDEDPKKNFKERVLFLVSDNACNVVGQIFKL